MKHITHFFAIAIVSMATTSAAHAWTINKSFDADADGSTCGNWDAATGSKVTSELAYGGGKSCKMSVTKGDTAFGKWGAILYHPTNVTRGGEIWFRIRMYMPAGFNYDSTAEGNRLKFMRIHTRNASNENFGYDDWYINPKGTNPPFSFIYEGEQVWGILSAVKDAIALGSWDTYEYYVKLDTVPASKGGQAIVRAWKNGTRIAELKDRVTLNTTDSYSDRTHLFTYWNGGAPPRNPSTSMM